jgi:hypothetical protein
VFVNNANRSALLPIFKCLAKARIDTYLQNSGVTTLNYTSKVGYIYRSSKRKY